jgi:succinoglycan biosynthesis transport protein ExoP
MNDNNNSTAVTSLADRWTAIVRRRRPAFWTTLAVLTITLGLAIFWPGTYNSMGTILIEQQELPADLVQPTITSYADERIQVISQRVMTTDNLLRIVERYSLYPWLRKYEPREVLLERMRSDINLRMISADVIDPRQGRPTQANIAFAVSYNSHSPETAARVANELVSLYLDENARSRRQKTTDAENFLDGEAGKVQKNIAQFESALAAFKDKHINTLPDQTQLNHETLIRTQDELRDIDTQLRSLNQQTTYLDAQLAQVAPNSQVYTATGERVLSPEDRLKYLRTEYARASAIYVPNHPDVLRLKHEIEGLERQVGPVDASGDLQRQLQDATTQLAEVQKRYAPDHPDVVRLQKQVTALQALIAAPRPSQPASREHPDNPAYIEVKAQRDAADAQIEALQTKRTEVQRQVEDLQGRLAVAPAVQRDFNALARELDNEQLRYRELRQKQMEAKLSDNLESEQKGERFTLIDPPRVPEQSATPNRTLLVCMGIVLALAAGIGMVALLESRDGSVRGRRELELMLGVPPLAILPLIRTHADISRQRWVRGSALAGAVAVFALALVLTHLFYRPLDVLWFETLHAVQG